MDGDATTNFNSLCYNIHSNIPGNDKPCVTVVLDNEDSTSVVYQYPYSKCFESLNHE